MAGYKIDFANHVGEPARKDVRWLRTDHLDPKIVKQNWLLTRRHQINTEDSFFQLGPLSIDWTYYDISLVMEDFAYRTP